jgi:hypothetical protein
MFHNLTHYYYCRWTRGMPYLIGVGMSFLYVEHGGPKKPTSLLVVSQRKIACATVILLTLRLYGTYGRLNTDGQHQGDCVWSSAQSFAWITFSNLAYSCCIGFVIWAGLLGYGSMITRFFASPLFTVASKLVYGAYLGQTILIIALWLGINRRPDWCVVILDCTNTTKIMIFFLKKGVSSKNSCTSRQYH